MGYVINSAGLQTGPLKVGAILAMEKTASI